MALPGDALSCPITLEIFRDPVIAQDGHTYERKAIEEWLQKNGTSPITNQKLSVEQLVPNYAIKKMVDHFENSLREKRFQYILDVDVRKKKGRPLCQTFNKTFYRAEWLPNSDGRPDIVLLKIDGARANKEASFYVDLSRHPHIVRTFGIARDEDDDSAQNSIMLVQEYASEGNLYELLSERKKPLEEKILIGMFLQVIDAMSYLALNNVVHGDLACRNVLVFRFDGKDPRNTVVKVTDFGLSRYSKIYTAVATVARTAMNTIPFRSSAPEILSTDVNANDCTEKSDVYAMGVLMWEAYSRGAIPWANVQSDEEVIRRVRNGEILPQPANCSSQYWNIITKTWHQQAVQRPTFDQLKKLFHKQLHPTIEPSSESNISSSQLSSASTSEHRSNSSRHPLEQSESIRSNRQGVPAFWKDDNLPISNTYNITHNTASVEVSTANIGDNEEIDSVDLTGQQILFDKQMCSVLARVRCGGEYLYALESDKSMTGYDGLCPKCRNRHVRFPDSRRGFYVSLENINERANATREDWQGNNCNAGSGGGGWDQTNAGHWNEIVDGSQEEDEMNLEGQTITFDNQTCFILKRFTCENNEYYAIESSKSMTGYNGRCLCGRTHVHFNNPRFSYYALVKHIHEKVYGDQISNERSKGPKSIDQLTKESRLLPPLGDPVLGRNKGIEGDANSNYMDSTIFCMFAYSGVFDTMLNKRINDRQIEKVQTLLRENIVNVLRNNDGFVERDALFHLRKLLSEATRDKSFIEDEKDPSEFLRALETLFHFAPLKTIQPDQPPNHDQSNITPNIMWEMFDANVQAHNSINIGRIFRNSLAEIPAKLATVPPFLILAAPRHSRTERSYRYIIPDREITIDNQMVQLVCQKCKRRSNSNVPNEFYACYDCPPKYSMTSADVLVSRICFTCIDASHNEKERATHKLKQMRKIATLNLFAVLCIERCHYVAFVKCHKQNNEHEWLFFDSMSDRVANEKNVPSVTRVPQFEQWIAQAENDGGFFKGIDDRRSSGMATSIAFPGDEMKKLRLFRDGAFFFYENATANYH